MLLNEQPLTLVVGSAPDAPVPARRPTHIYAANRALARVREGGVVTRGMAYLTSVVGARTVLNPLFQSAAIEANPNRIVVRGKGNLANILPKSALASIVTENLDPKGLSIQRQFFSRRVLAHSNFLHFGHYLDLRRILNVALRFNRGGVTGTSTGLFCALLALIEVPEGPVVLTGISFRGGAHYYAGKEMRARRAGADRYLCQALEPQVRDRLFVMTEDAAQASKLRMFSE